MWNGLYVSVGRDIYSPVSFVVPFIKVLAAWKKTDYDKLILNLSQNICDASVLRNTEFFVAKIERIFFTLASFCVFLEFNLNMTRKL
jgi:hypothetical protein